MKIHEVNFAEHPPRLVPLTGLIDVVQPGVGDAGFAVV